MAGERFYTGASPHYVADDEPRSPANTQIPASSAPQRYAHLWTPFEMPFATPADERIENGLVRLSLNAMAGTVYFDDLSLE